MDRFHRPDPDSTIPPLHSWLRNDESSLITIPLATDSKKTIKEWKKQNNQIKDFLPNPGSSSFPLGTQPYMKTK